jgi:hypothetical protein
VRIGAAAFRRVPAGAARVNAIEESHQPGPAGVRAGASSRSFQGKTHLHVRRAELLAGEQVCRCDRELFRGCTVIMAVLYGILRS